MSDQLLNDHFSSRVERKKKEVEEEEESRLRQCYRMAKVLTPPRLTSRFPPLENWLVRWYNMVRPRLRASVKREPFFLLCLLSSIPVKQTLRSLCTGLKQRECLKRTLYQSKQCFTSVRLTFLLLYSMTLALFPLCFTSRHNQINSTLQCPFLMSKCQPGRSNTDEQSSTDKMKAGGGDQSVSAHKSCSKLANKSVHIVPSFLLLWFPLPCVSEMSLKEKRKRTISPFSFFMGTMSSRHQKATPGRGEKIQFHT